MTTRENKDNGLPPSQIGSAHVASEDQIPFLKEAFVWALDTTHWPMPLKELPLSKVKARRRRQLLRAYQLLLGRVTGLRRRFPREEPLKNIAGTISLGIRELRANQGEVAYLSKGGFGWHTRKRTMPAIGPRLLLAVCIAKELWPKRSPYQAAVEQQGYAQDPNPEVVDSHRRAIEKQVFRVLNHPEKYLYIGVGHATDPYVLLKHELFHFKMWREDQREDRSRMSIEEYDRQFYEYLNRIHPTPEEETLLANLLEQFKRTSRCGSRRIAHQKPCGAIWGESK
jgi:hypothetical protein